MQRKILIGIGIFILFLLHVAAAFALGIYVGRHGLTREGLTLQTAGSQRPVAVQDQNRPALTEAPDVIGRVRGLGRGAMQLATSDGPRLVVLSESTVVKDASGGVNELSALKEGMLVAVYGEFEGGGTGLKAQLVILLPDNDVKPQRDN